MTSRRISSSAVNGVRANFSKKTELAQSSGRSTTIHRRIGAISRGISSGCPDINTDDRIVIVGTGVAGCASALIAAEQHKVPVTLVCAGSAMTDCNSYWAQGGIIYRNSDPASNDSEDSLAKDVHRAGAGLSVDSAVRKLAREGPGRVSELLLGMKKEFANVPFDRDEQGNLRFCLEASHAAPRIIHYADCTGKAITEHITAAVASHPRITVLTDTIVTDLITQDFSQSSVDPACLGVRTVNKKTGVSSSLFAARGTVLASGGLGGIYEHSTNPLGFNALGSSVALASRSDVHTSDLEYVQFHPTALFIPNTSRFLLTEALRGEGAILRDRTGRAFGTDFHPDGELAPRDIVARGVFNEVQKSTSPDEHNAFLDISHRDAQWLRGRFPTIDKHLHGQGIDMTKQPIPIVPAAHYTCGGVTTNLDGQTSLKGLYAAGESARTGLHGGNRLASTSLLEGLVYGAAVADHIGNSDEARETREWASRAIDQIKSEGVEDRPQLSSASPSAASSTAKGLLFELRRTMWDYVGVVRTPTGLSTAISDLRGIREEAEDLFATCITAETAGLRDAAYAGEAVALAAHSNRVSAGAHCVVLEDYGSDSDSDSESVAAAGA